MAMAAAAVAAAAPSRGRRNRTTFAKDEATPAERAQYYATKRPKEELRAQAYAFTANTSPTLYLNPCGTHPPMLCCCAQLWGTVWGGLDLCTCQPASVWCGQH